jgi:hypothetical protein
MFNQFQMKKKTDQFSSVKKSALFFNCPRVLKKQVPKDFYFRLGFLQGDRMSW